MGIFHDVKPGDHIPRIAARYGFGTIADIWDDPNNAELRQLRKPCVLAPGDTVFVPARITKAVSVATDRTHSFIIQRQRIVLRLVLKNASGKALAGVDCELACESETFSLTTDNDGKVEQEIPIDSKSCKLTYLDREFQLAIGFLDPPELPSGWRTRLNNLGYHAGPGPEDDDAAETE